MRHVSLCVLALGLVSALSVLPASAQDVKVEKYKLPNGMTVILHEDHSLPVATVNTWYHVGAQDEPPGRSGFAHLFEHLMFMGTRRVPGNNFDILMEGGGGANNASTDLHRTNYFSWGPSKLLPTLLWLDADRLEDMGLTMNVDKLNKQRDVVRNELRQTVENAPYGKASEYVSKLMYQPSHPYYNGVIGTHEDLEAANVVNVKDFFANFYVPSNASLVIAGDFDPAVIKPLVSQIFGTLPPGAPITRKYTPPADPIPVKLDGVKRYTCIDKVQLPKVQFSYHSPVAFGPGDAEAVLITHVLADGKASRLYKRLVMEEKLAVETSASQSGFPLGSLLQIDVLAKPEADLDRVEKIMDEEVARLVKDGPTADELDRFKAQIELGALQTLQSIERKADKLNEYEYYWGEPNSFKRDIERFRAATPQSVKEWAGRILTPNARAIVRVLPEEPDRQTSPRDKRPDEAVARPFALPASETFVLSNGLSVVVLPKPDLPLVAIHLFAQPGGATDLPGKEGLATLAADMLSEGTKDLDSLAFENAVQSIGATFGAGASHETLDVQMTVLGRNLDRGVKLFADAVRRPRLNDSDWTRVKTIAIENLHQEQESPTAVAARVGDRLFYGDAHPYGTPPSGTIRSVESLTLADVGPALGRLLQPGRCTIIIAGDITAAQARAAMEQAFGDWKPAADSGAVRAIDGPPKAAAGGPRVVIVDRPGAVQTVIRFVAPGVKRADPSRVSRSLLNTILGGSFTSRLNQNLREDHGYTYGAKSHFDMGISGGDFSAGASVKADTTGASLREFLKEFARLREGSGDITADEATKARETLRNETIRGFSGLSGLVAAAVDRLTSHLALASITADLAAMETVAPEALNTLAKSALPLEQGVLVLVGDKALILSQIKQFNWPAPIECDPEGNLIAPN